MSLDSAFAYYHYGNALLTKEEEEPSDDLLGPTPKQENGPQEDQENEVEGEEEDGEHDEAERDGDDNDDAEAPKIEGAEETDLEVAWEVLDVSRPSIVFSHLFS
jgi:cobalamin biosynthesis protein CobT